MKKIISIMLVVAMLLISLVTIAYAKELKDIYSETANTLNKVNPQVSSVGGEWVVLGLCRSGLITKETADNYYANLCALLDEKGSAKLHKNKSTENSRAVIALSAMGKNATDVNGYNLLEPLFDFDYVEKQGINGTIFALIALDTKQYEIAGEGNSREKMINAILSEQLQDGGFNLSGDSANVDITAMAITGLAPYYSTNATVKEAVDKALDCISALQNEKGGFSSFDTSNSESISQAIVALCSLGIDPKADARFVKAEGDLLTALCEFNVEGGFCHTKDGGYDQMATEQAFYALVAYFRFAEGNNTLYNMMPEKPKEDKDNNVIKTDNKVIEENNTQSFTNDKPSVTPQKTSNVQSSGSAPQTDSSFDMLIGVALLSLALAFTTYKKVKR